MHWNEIFNLLRCKVERILGAVSGFTNPLSSRFEDNELYFLSFGVPAKRGKAKDLIEADDIGWKAVADFIDSHLVKKSVFHNPLKCYKLTNFWCLRGQARRNCPIYETKSIRWELKGASLVSMTFFLLDIILTLSWHCRSFWDLYHGLCQLLIEFPQKLTSPNFRMACNHTLNQH